VINEGMPAKIRRMTMRDELSIRKISRVTGLSRIDQFGLVGCDPSTAWTSEGASTLDTTRRRRTGVMAGSVPSVSAVCGWAFSTEW